MQNIIVAIIVIAAVWYLGRRFYRNAKALEQDACGCGCDGCTQVNICDEMPDKEPDKEIGCEDYRAK